MGRMELMRKQKWTREAKKKGVDPKKYIKQQQDKRSTTWTNREGLIIQAKGNERVGSHISRERGAGGKGKPNWWRRLKSTINAGMLTGNNKNPVGTSKNGSKKNRYKR